jgi:hypothetical protein
LARRKESQNKKFFIFKKSVKKYINMITVNFTEQIQAEKQKKTLNKPFRTPGGPKKFGVYVKNDKGNVVLVRFGDPDMEIKRDNPQRRKSFRARHNCSDPGPKWKANYWSCYQWRAGAPVEGSEIDMEVEAGKGLWYNIEKKKERMGKNYKPAKPGDKDYPKQDALKKAQAEEWDGETFWKQEELLKINPSLANVEEVNENCDCGCQECKGSDDLEMVIALIKKATDQMVELQSLISNVPDVDGWVLAEITKIADYTNTIHTYIKYDESEETPEEEAKEEATEEEQK